MELTLNLPIELFVNVDKSLKVELEQIILLEMWKRGYLSDGKFAELYGVTKWELPGMNKDVKKALYSEEYLLRDLKNMITGTGQFHAPLPAIIPVI
jgi:hypothetical protein